MKERPAYFKSVSPAPEFIPYAVGFSFLNQKTTLCALRFTFTASLPIPTVAEPLQIEHLGDKITFFSMNDFFVLPMTVENCLSVSLETLQSGN